MRRFHLDRYAHRRPLRVGCLSQCFGAESLGTSGEARPVLLKQLLPALARDPSVAARWLEIAEQNMALQHRGCAQILDLGFALGPSDPEAWFAVEQVDGVSLRELLLASRNADLWPDETTVVALLWDVLDALVSGQDVALPHLDLHTESVLVRGDGGVVLTEFSMFRALPATLATRQRFDKGRAAYLSPELARGEDGDFRTDVFALGVMLFELVSKRRPFDGSTQLTTAMQVASGKRDSLRAAAGHVTAELCDIVETMLAVSPLERFQSPRAALGAFTATLTRNPDAVRTWLGRVRPAAHHGLQVAPTATPTAPRVKETSDSLSPPLLGLPNAQAGAPTPSLFLGPPPLLASRIHVAEPAGAVADDAWLSPPPLLSHAIAPEPIGEVNGQSAAHQDALGAAVRDGKTASLRADDVALLVARGAPVISPGSAANNSPAVDPPGLSPPPPLFASAPGPTAVPSAVVAPPRVASPLAHAPMQVHAAAPLSSGFPSSSMSQPMSAAPDTRDDQRWYEPSKTVFQRKAVLPQATRRAKARMPLYAVILLAALFSSAIAVGGVLLWRLLS